MKSKKNKQNSKDVKIIHNNIFNLFKIDYIMLFKCFSYSILKIIFFFIAIGWIVNYIYKNYFVFEGFDIDTKKFENLTNKWLDEISLNKDPTEAYKLFCSDGSFIGTVSEIKKEGEDIKSYFNYFANLPGLKVVKKTHNVSKVTDNVYTNTAFVTWSWDDLDEPLNTKIIFTFKDKCIYQLDTNKFPDEN